MPVPDLDAGLRFYAEALGHRLKWRNDEVGQAGLGLPGGDTELVLVLLDLSRGRYQVDESGAVTGVAPAPPPERDGA